MDALEAALGRDGRDPFWLQEADLSQHAVQVKIGFEEYGGKTRIRAPVPQPLGSSSLGGACRADEATRHRRVLRSGLAGCAQPVPET